MNLLPGASLTSAVLGFLVIMAWRIGESHSAVTARKIVIPPLGMATGFCMFLAPGFRMPWTWAAVAFLVGALLLAEPLIRTSHLKLVGETVMMHRSPAFFFVIVVLALVRFLARGYLDRFITIEQSGGLFFILAFGMIVRWRVTMYREYRRVTQPHPLVLRAGASR
ncbi:MAG: cytochrome c biogenesis protein CcdC [Acidobacteriaceae bacterium]|jgi:membrane protein CcdC involved in cytochrome C biogenesis